MSAKKLLNGIEDCVDEGLNALVAINPSLSLVKNHRVIVRSDVEKVKGKVALLCGGGSGHEPAFSGYVGRGCLSAAVAGSVFASPPPTAILAALMTLASINPSGILVIVYNYTGDRVNFGLACERIRFWSKVRCEMFINADDTALLSADRTAGRRGLCGGKLAIKIAGAMAEQGKSLDEILRVLNTMVKPHLGTIGLSLTPCVVPGRTEPSFFLENDQMELGLGAHGEAGVRRVPVGTARESVATMLRHMTNATSASHLTLTKGDKVAVLVNNLGSMSNLEMGVICNEVVSQLENGFSVIVQRFYTGRFFTSLEMQGVSISILKLTGNIAEYLDFDARCPAWSAETYSRDLSAFKKKEALTFPDPIRQVASRTRDQGVKHITVKGAAALGSAVRAACEALIDSEGTLNKMDSGGGDSDCGTTLRRGAEAALKGDCLTQDNLACPSQLLRGLGSVAETAMGGSSGAMYSILFEAAAIHMEESGDEEVTSVGQAFKAGLDAVMKYGGAQVGDRTMVDALSPAVSALLEEEDQVSALKERVGKAAQAAQAGARATLVMRASAGRASYVDASQLIHPDPGAHAVGIIIGAINDTLN